MRQQGLTLECINLLEEIANTNDIQLIWVPAHSGIYGNIQADAIAKFAATEATSGPEPFVAPYRNVGRSTNDKWLEEQMNVAWRGERRCAHTKHFILNVNPKITEQLLNMSRQEVRVVTGLITGHCRLNDHFAKIGMRDDPDCDLCGRERETAMHIICSCRSLNRCRMEIYRKEVLTAEEICSNPLRKLVKYHEKCCEAYSRLSRIF